MLDFANIDKQEMLGCIYAKKLLEKLMLVNEELLGHGKRTLDIAEVEKGICYAKYYHADQMRDSGDPYYSHPLEVAYMVLDHLPRTDIIITAILHDTIEDTKLTRNEITEVFGTQIADQVYDLTRIKEDGVKISSAQMIEELWLAQKYNMLFVKLFDRLHNMQTLEVKSSEKIKKIMNETLESFLVSCIFLDDWFVAKNSLIKTLEQLCDKSTFKSQLSIGLNFNEYSDQLQPLDFQNEVVQTYIQSLLERELAVIRNGQSA